MQVIDKLAWLHVVNHRILSTRSRGKNTYYIPGGKRENGESDSQALIREIREELSVELVPDQLRFVGTFEAQADGKPGGVVVRMTCYEGPYSGALFPASEIEQMSWLRYADRERSSAVDKVIFDWLFERGLIR